MKRLMLALIVCLPLASVALGGVMMYLALQGDDTDVLEDSSPLSKTSWKQSDEAQP